MKIVIGTKRELYRDFDKVTSEYRTEIMGIAMLSVMLFHQCFTRVVPLNIFHNIGNWGVDVFLFLSGMGLVRSLEKYPLLTYYMRRFKRIIPCCVLCGTTKYIIFLMLGSSVAILEDGLKMGWWSLASLDLWFIPSIIILYLISPILYCTLCKWTSITLATIFISMYISGLTISPIVGFDWNTPLGVFSCTIERMPVFAAGMFVSIKNKWINDKIPYSVPFIIAAIGIILLNKTGFSLYGYKAYIYMSLTLGMPSLIMINICFLKILPNMFKSCIVFCGSYSLELYLVHEFIFWTMKIIFVDTEPWILLVSSFTLSCLSAYICRKSIKILFHY